MATTQIPASPEEPPPQRTRSKREQVLVACKLCRGRKTKVRHLGDHLLGDTRTQYDHLRIGVDVCHSVAGSGRAVSNVRLED